MAEQASAAGLPAPEIEDDGLAVTVRFPHSQFVPPSITGDISKPEDRRQLILALLDRVEGA